MPARIFSFTLLVKIAVLHVQQHHVCAHFLRAEGRHADRQLDKLVEVVDDEFIVTSWKWRRTACLIIASSAAMTNAVFFRNRTSRIASSVEMVVSGRQRSRSSIRTTSVTSIASSVFSKLSRRACIS